MRKVIALLTDFGPKGSHYVASMKGVILKINPEATIIDISHNTSSYSIIEASYLLKSTYKSLPENTIIIVVVDPGVGSSSRKILAIQTKTNYYFVGPDNGIFYNFLSKDEIEECVIVNNENYFIKPVSNTFHGRDIMAPVGANILKGVPLSNFGPRFDPKNFVKYPIKFEILPKRNIINCMIQYIDSFGNGTTNIPIEANLIKGTSSKLKEGENLKIIVKNQEYAGVFTSHFSNVPINSLLFLQGSSNFLEISINQGNAAKRIGFKVGETIKFVLG